MLRLTLRLTLCLLLLALPARAEEVVLGLSQDEVAITATFDGSQILVFGAVKREEPIPAGPPLQVVVAASGPSEPLLVR
ncbi:MAG: TIGR02186 family protein, partial [Pseudomonadota bacterium]